MNRKPLDLIPKPLAEIGRDFLSPIKRPNLDKSDEYKDALVFLDGFEDDSDSSPEDDAFVMAHAKERHSEEIKTEEILVAKAERLAMFDITVATALLALVGFDKVADARPLVLAAFLFLVASFYAIRAQATKDVALLPSVRKVVEGARRQNGPGRWLAASYHATVVGLAFSNRWAAACVRSSFRLTFIAAVVLLIAISWLVFA